MRQVTITAHALQRWRERFGLDESEMRAALASTRNLTKRERAYVRASCPKHAHLLQDRMMRGAYYRVGKSKWWKHSEDPTGQPIFVISAAQEVITVFPMNSKEVTR